MRKGFSFQLKAGRWAAVLLLLSLPFILRMGLNPQKLHSLAVEGLYEHWYWDFGKKNLQAREGATVLFVEDAENPHLSEVFRQRLSQDFKLLPGRADFQVHVYFNFASRLRMRVESLNSESRALPAWQGEKRLVNNAIVLGPLVFSLAALFNAPITTAFFLAVLWTVFWASRWSFFGFFGNTLDQITSLVQEIFTRFHHLDLSALSINRVFEVLCFVSLFLIFGLQVLFRKTAQKTVSSHRLFYLLLFFLGEPLLLYVFSQFSEWGSDVSILRLYFSTFAFRFSSAIFLFSLGNRRSQETLPVNQGTREDLLLPAFYRVLFLLILLAVGWWDWINGVLSFSNDSGVFRLKLFFLSFLISFLLGSRWIALTLMSASFAALSVPHLGHWNAGIQWAFIWEGCFIGWALNPRNFLQLRQIYPRVTRKRAIFVALLTWFLGFFLTSMGAPVIFCWVLIAVTYWGYMSMSSMEQRRLLSSESDALS